MRWKGRRVSTNLEDRRGGGGVKAGGISIIGLVVAFIAWKFFGVDPQQAYQATQAVTSETTSTVEAPQNLTLEQKEASEFVGTVLADTEDTWTPIFQQLGMTYKPPRLVLFSGVVKSGCGTAQSAMGPFYCPADQKVYIDTSFFKICANKWVFLVSKIKQNCHVKIKLGILHKLMSSHMRLDIIFRTYLVSQEKCSRLVRNPAKLKEINFQFA